MSSPIETFDVLGTPVSAVTLDETVDIIDGWIQDDSREHVCCCSVNMVLTARDDAGLRRALDTAGLVTPDGFPLTMIGHRRATSEVGRVRGTDVTLRTCQRAAEEGHSVFFYGGAPGVPEEMADRLRGRFPGLEVAGTRSPPFRPLTPEEDREEIDRINGASPDVLFVGLGCPKQERWVVDHREALEVPVQIAVGAAFDFIAGTKPEAPDAVQRLGAEWAWRFLSEPKRLWPRVFVDGPKFATLLLRERLGASGSASES